MLANWVRELPIVLLGLRSALQDTGVTASQLLYGQTIRLPGDLLQPTNVVREPNNFVQNLRESIQHAIHTNPDERFNDRKIFIPQTLATASHVFVRHDAASPPLTPPYDGPYRVLKRHEHFYEVELPRGPKAISIERLKPAFLLQPNTDTDKEAANITPPEIPQRPATKNTTAPAPATAPPQPYVTRSGRISKQRVRFR